MADEEKMKRNGTNGFAHLTHDVLSLCELQGQLLKLDVQSSLARTRNAAVVVAVGAVLLGAALLIGLVALAELLVEQFSLPRSSGYGAVALATLVVGGIVVQAARVRFRRAAGTWNRSYEELTKNLAWVKSQLHQAGENYSAKAEKSAMAPRQTSNGHTRRFTT